MLDTTTLTVSQVIHGVLDELKKRYVHEEVALTTPIGQIVAWDCDGHRDRAGQTIYTEATVVVIGEDTLACACHKYVDGYPAQGYIASLLVMPLLHDEDYDAAIAAKYRQSRADQGFVVMLGESSGTFSLRAVGDLAKKLPNYIRKNRKTQAVGIGLLHTAIQTTAYDPAIVSFLTDWLVGVFIDDEEEPGRHPYLSVS